MSIYIHQKHNWPNFNWDSNEVIVGLGDVRHLQGRLLGKMQSIGFEMQAEATLRTLTADVLKSSEIEGEILEQQQVRSSIAHKLGFDITDSVAYERDVEGVVEMMLDATQRYHLPLTKERLFSWHASLFPAGWGGQYRVQVGRWREDTTGPMQVVSGAMGKERVHFEAPSSRLLEFEMSNFLNWFEQNNKLDLVLKAAIAHLWFVTIHPFDDGNGRITRALTDLLLARSDNSIQRFYSMSSQIRIQRKEYYDILEKTQKGGLDITRWILWFLDCLGKCIHSSDLLLAQTMKKSAFWKNHATTQISERQQKIINRMLDGFDGKLTSSKWAKINRCSQDTALRDIQDLIDKNILRKEIGGGRSTSYRLVESVINC